MKSVKHQFSVMMEQISRCNRRHSNLQEMNKLDTVLLDDIGYFEYPLTHPLRVD